MTIVTAAVQPPRSLTPTDTRCSGARATLDLNVVATPEVVLRVASILARRHCEVVTMRVDKQRQGRRRINVEVACAGSVGPQSLARFLAQSADVLDVELSVESDPT